MSSITPHVSFIMRCYNEEESIAYTIPRLCREFKRAGYRLELVVCNNGPGTAPARSFSSSTTTAIRTSPTGSSHVRTTTAIEFITRLLQFKFGRTLKD